jgi:hypothetical protein
MKRWIIAAGVTLAVGTLGATPAFANPTGNQGPPSQSCQGYAANVRPGNSASSPGSPFNEPGINSVNGGNGGAHYSEKAQYDVACFQWAAHHPQP